MFHDPFAMFGNHHVGLHSADTFFCADPGTIVTAVRPDPHIRKASWVAAPAQVTAMMTSANGWTSYPWSMVANQQRKLSTGMTIQVVLFKQIQKMNYSEVYNINYIT